MRLFWNVTRGQLSECLNDSIYYHDVLMRLAKEAAMRSLMKLGQKYLTLTNSVYGILRNMKKLTFRFYVYFYDFLNTLLDYFKFITSNL